jgi:hypothetical protein
MDPAIRRITREELLRSIAWAGLGLVGWAILATEFAWLAVNAFTVFGLPVLTWASLTVAFIGARLVLDADLRVGTRTGLAVALVLGMLVGGAGAMSLVSTAGYPAVPVTVGYAVVTVGSVVWFVRRPLAAATPP